MKIKQKKFALKTFAVVATTFAIVRVTLAADPTAFELIKLGDQYVGVQSKDQVVQIRSEKSIGTLIPAIWYVVYYDPDAAFKATEVKFGAGEKLDVSHPWRILERISNDKNALDNAKLKVDSDQVLKIAMAQPLLENLKLKATQLWLQHGDQGPEWKVKLWAAKLKDPDDDADIGVVVISTTDGSIIKTDLHPDSAD